MNFKDMKKERVLFMKQALKVIGIIFLLVGAVSCVCVAADFYEKRLKRCYYAAN